MKKREVDIISRYKWWINEELHRWSFDKPLKIVYHWYLKYLLTQTFFLVIAQWRFHSTWSTISFPKMRRKKNINWILFPHFFKLCAAFGTHWWIQTAHLFYASSNLRDLIAATGLVISNWIQIVNFSARVTVKFDGWPCNTIGHLFYATSSFVHHFVAIGELKLQLQSGNAQSGSNSMIFRGVRPWNLMDDLAKQ